MDSTEKDFWKNDDLADLDLSQIDTTTAKRPTFGWAASWFPALGVVALLSVISLVLWLPTTALYHQASGGWLFLALNIAAFVAAVAGGRLVWAWMERQSALWGLRTALNPEVKDRTLSRGQRATLLVGALLGLCLVLVSPSQIAPGLTELDGYATGLGAVIAALFGGRWLSATATVTPSAETAGWVSQSWRKIPTWLKILSFSSLGITLLVVSAQRGVWGGLNNTDSSVFGAAALIAGMTCAVLASRWVDRIQSRYHSDGSAEIPEEE